MQFRPTQWNYIRSTCSAPPPPPSSLLASPRFFRCLSMYVPLPPFRWVSLCASLLPFHGCSGPEKMGCSYWLANHTVQAVLYPVPMHPAPETPPAMTRSLGNAQSNSCTENSWILPSAGALTRGLGEPEAASGHCTPAVDCCGPGAQVAGRWTAESRGFSSSDPWSWESEKDSQWKSHGIHFSRDRTLGFSSFILFSSPHFQSWVLAFSSQGPPAFSYSLLCLWAVAQGRKKKNAHLWLIANFFPLFNHQCFWYTEREFKEFEKSYFPCRKLWHYPTCNDTS